MPVTKRNKSNLQASLAITRFPNQKARVKRDLTMTMGELADWVTGQTAADKGRLPWIKLATFGPTKTDKGCLRHDANVQTITGVEADYDAGEVGPDAAHVMLQEAGVAGLVYTTASHTPEAPRWRVLCPTSGPLPPDARKALIERLNGVLGGGLDGTSFVLSQSYYAGSVEGGEPVQTFLSDGDYIDNRDDLARLPKGKHPTGAVIKDDSGSGVAYRLMLDLFASGSTIEEARIDIENDAGPAGDWWHRTTEREQERTLENAAAKVERENECTADFDLAAEVQGWIPEVELSAAEQAEIDALIGITTPASPTWGSPMMRGATPYSNLHNAEFYLGTYRDTILPGLRFNQMTQRSEWQRGEVDDAALAIARKGMERAGMMTVGMDLVASAVDSVARVFAHHPVRDWLGEQIDDGRGLMDDWMSRYLGAEDTIYTRAVGRMFLIQAVARVMQPGCKGDYMPVLHGAQGLGKSSACRALAGDTYFSDSMPPIRSDRPKEAMAFLQGLWMVEVAEMASMRESAQDDLKSFITRQVDRYRDPYGRLDQPHPRQCVFIGTTNKDTFLRDETGSRRFWPIGCEERCDPEALAHDRGQLFAEAVAAYKAGEQWWPDRDFEAQHMRPEQEAVFGADPWELDIGDLLDQPKSEFGEEVKPIRETTLQEIMDGLGLQPMQRTRGTQMRIAGIMKERLGWKRVHTKRGKVWRRNSHLQVVK